MKEIEIHFKGGDGKRIKTLPEVPDNNDYVDLLTPQDIDGKKNFIQTPTINGKDIATQETLNEVSNSKQNTLTAGNGISIENDTISVTDAGGLTVLPYGTLDADTLAKVKANPQNYCIRAGAYTQTLCYYEDETSTKLLYTSQKIKTLPYEYFSSVEQNRIEINKTDGKINSNSNHIIEMPTSMFKVEGNYNEVNIIGVKDTTNRTIKTGTEIRKAITIRKWH